MENAADALKIAFAIFVFVLAITITFSLVSQAKSTSDYVLYYSDETNFYEPLNSREKNRVVSTSEVITSLYRYYKESIGVTVNIDGNTYTFDLDNQESIMDEIGKTKLSSRAEREENLNIFIENYLLKDNIIKYTEEFVEVPFSGIYEIGEDDTELVISSGGKKVYITYTEFTE